MSVQERKERERADRERLIVATARELAEQQGLWGEAGGAEGVITTSLALLHPECGTSRLVRLAKLFKCEDSVVR